MSKIVLKRYTPLYIALLVIGIVMVLLFLRPESALGLTVDVNAVKKFEGFTAGFKLDEGTGQPETVVIEAKINLPEGEFQDIVKATLDIETADGGSGFLNVSAVELPLPASTGDPVIDRELTDQITQGQLFVDAKLVRLVPDAFGYGYGYRAIGGKGFIKFTLRYI